MKYFFLIAFYVANFCVAQNVDSLRSIESVNQYVSSIRNNDAELRKFLAKMPKGGDLHHHYSGSVYAETYLKYVEEEDVWVNRISLAISDKCPAKKSLRYWAKVSVLKKENAWYEIRMKLLEAWSVLYFNGLSEANDVHFFSTFNKFDIPKDATFDEGLLEIKNRAVSENVSYIETIFEHLNYDTIRVNEVKYDSIMHVLQQARKNGIKEVFSELYSEMKVDTNYAKIIIGFNKKLKERHQRLAIDDSLFTLRYQNYAVRVLNPTMVFTSLFLAFESAATSDLIVGVNFVAPENNPVSLRDYWLHIQMFKFFREKYPKVKVALHAGELTLGMVLPEELQWHISEAVFTAEADRIGHGVDIAYEKDADKILKFMSDSSVAVEINLVSNDFILGVNKERHPVLLYKKAGVPIVISTDDAGVLRTDFTEQFLILLRNYPEITYADVKQMIFNSINFSFLDDSLKFSIKANLDAHFKIFERNIN